MIEAITLFPISIFANTLIGISTVIEFYFGLWYHWFLWITVFGIYDVWTWIHQEYRDSFKLCRSLFFKVLWKNRHFRPGLLPVHIIAACLLLHKKQERERKEHKGFRDVNEVFKNTNAPSWMSDLAVAQKYMKVSLAMYGWKYAIHRAIFNSYRGLLKFYYQHFLCFVYRPRHLVVKGDPWRRNLAGLISQSDLTQKDIYLASFDDKLFAIPFCVSIRTETRSIVVSLRGSYSMGDWITDFTATLTDPIKIHNGYRAHKGMWNSAKYVFCQLETNKILQKLFEHEEYKDFDLVVTGHSLGAGTSVLLGVLLREVYHDRVKVYAFSCPGWLVDAELAKVCEDYVLVFGVGNDIVLRAGVNSMNKLVNDATNELEEKITKFDKMLSTVYKWMVVTAKSTWNSSMITHNTSNAAPLTLISLMKRSEEPDQLYLPGRILHISEDRDMLACRGNFTARLADKDEFLEVLVMQTMFHDHIAENVMNAIDKLASYQDTKINKIVPEANGKP